MTVKERLDAMVDMAVMELKMKETQEYGTVTEGVYPMMIGDVWTFDGAISGVQIFPPDIHAVAKEVGAEVLENGTESYFMYRNIAFFSYKGQFKCVTRLMIASAALTGADAVAETVIILWSNATNAENS